MIQRCPSCLWLVLAAVLTGCSLVSAQQTSATGACNPWKRQTFSAEFSFSQRTCMELSPLASPMLALRATAMAGYGVVRHSPELGQSDVDAMARRIGNYYARRGARAGAELLVGQLHHEDPRYRPSTEQSGWKRAKWALLSVVRTTEADGTHRAAFAPLSGSLASGFTSMALYERQNTWDYAMRRSGIVYGHYFAGALLAEFAPDLWAKAPAFLRKHK